MILASFPRANSNVRALVQGLHGAGLLHSFHTTLAFDEDDTVLKFIPAGLRAELLKRSFGIPKSMIHQYPFLEMVRLAASRAGMTGLTDSYSAFASTDQTCIALDRAVARYIDTNGRRPGSSRLTGVYCYEDSAMETFKSAKRQGLSTFYELTIPYWETARKILGEEGKRRPEWAPTMGALTDPQEKLEVKRQEIELADVVLCISKFVQRTLPPDILASKKTVALVYGTPPMTNRVLRPKTDTSGKLRVLFVGSLTQRKGLADLFDAMKLLKRNDVELVVLGAPVVPFEFYRNQFPDFTYIPPCTLDEVLEIMQTSDVFAFPSLLEGRGLVQLEAMSCGLPLITTVNATGDDLIDDGKEGFLVPICDPRAIAEKISWFADNRASCREMGEAARAKSTSFRWDEYLNIVLGAIT